MKLKAILTLVLCLAILLCGCSAPERNDYYDPPVPAVSSAAQEATTPQIPTYYLTAS